MKFPSYLKVALATTLNITFNAATLGRYLWLEGRVRRGVFMNWTRRFRYKPKEFVQPTTEEDLVKLVRNSRSLRLFGSGHSFNSGVVSDGTLVSLDDYSGVVWENLDTKQVAVRGGTRVRDVVKLLLDKGLAFAALPSHDAQSIAGALSTDVHGTGKDWGFVSDSVVRLKLIDGNGDIYECEPSDDLFKAAIGGVGAVGIITEVVIQGVPRFNVEQKVRISEISFVEKNLDRLLRENDHFSLYLFPFTNKCQINVWKRTHNERAPLGDIWEFISISKGALLSAWVGNLLAYTGLLPTLSALAGIKRGTDLVMESNKAFNRTIYHLHQELEFTVHFEDTFDVCRRFIRLYGELYSSGLPYTLFEVRFTPDKHEHTLIGPGRDRRSTWIDLVCNDSDGFEKCYAAAQKLIKEVGGRPHLGKFCEGFDKVDMMELHRDNFTRFLDLVEKHDPDRKFVNEFTQRLFGHRLD